MQNLNGYSYCLTNVPSVIESTFNQISLNFEKKIKESLFTSAMLVYLSRINQSEGIVFKIYRNNKEIPLKIDYDENIPVNSLLSEVGELINNLQDENYIFDNELLHAYSIFNRKLNDEFVPHEKSILNCLFDENSVEFVYNDSIFPQVQMEFLIDNINELINRMDENPDILLKDLSIVSDKELELLKSFSKTDRLDFDENETIMNYIHNNAFKTPNQIAVSDTITDITYAEFDRYINALSAILHNLGVEKGECVGVLLPRIPMYIVSCMGITRNGSVFVPLDLTYPKDRIDYIIEESEMNYIISSKSVDFASQFEDRNILYIEDLDLDTDEISPNNVVASDLAAIYFTSGSTGKPKGVKVSHYTFLLEALYSSKYLTSGSNIACYVNLTFSFSVVSYSAFVKGANCIILNEHLKENVPELIEFLQVTPLDVLIVPTILGATILERTEIKTKNMIIAGERLKEVTPTILSRKTDLINCYGTTETLVIAYQDVKKASQFDEIPVGYPAGNSWVYIVDKNNMPVPIGVPGEIVVSGLKLALGYYNNETQTKETFVENPFSDCWENERMLHTRDQGYLTFDGELVVKGRIDRQIKLRGLRIEPGEIENVVLNYSPSITNVVVELRNDNLVCYYISDGEIDEDELNEFIKSKVTPYMVPSFYMKMDEFPLNLNGKVDVKALPTPEFAIEEIIEPKTEIEIKLFEIISKVLKTDKFGVTTDLIKLGLTSLSSIKIAYEIASNWGVQLTIKELSESRNIQNMANLIDTPIESVELSHEKQDMYPLSQNQLGVYFESIKHPDKLIYNTTSAVDLGSNIDVEKLKSSIINLVNKYTYLKSILLEENGKTYLKRQDDEPVVVDIFESLATDEIKSSFARPFDLFKGPLYRFEIYYTEDKTILLMDVHHILFDGTSVNLFINELLDEYDDVNDAEEVSSGFDFILDEKELEGSEKYLKAKEFFEERLADIENVTSIEPDIIGEKELGSLKEVSVPINKENIFGFSKRNGITPNSLFLASSLLTLSKFSYTKDMLLTTISNGRINPKYFKTLAMIVRSLPIAMTLDTNQSVLDYINSVNDTFVDTIDNESYPFTKIFEEYNFVPEIYYAYQVGLFDEKVLRNGNKVKVEPLELDYPKFNICIYVEEDLENINLIIRYNDQLYSYELMETLVESIDLVLNKFMDSLTQNASDVSLLTSLEENEIVKKENELTLDIHEPLLKDKFEYIASKKADDIAVYANDTDLTFDELNAKANVFANSLIDKGLRTNDKIILKLNRTSKLMIALIGSLKAGVSFIPVDPKYPQERITHIQEDSGCNMIISDDPLTGEVDIDNLLDGVKTQNPKVDLKNDDIAFLIYTSGSTGLPKGVMIKQDGITNYIKPTPENSPINAIANDVSRMLSITTVSFIAFLREAFASVMNGVPMVLADEETSLNPIKLAELIKKYEIDGMSATPSRLQQYLTIDDFKRVIKDIKVITIGGEKFIDSLYPTLVKYTDADIYNSYGPTEVTIASHAKLMQDNIVSEGKPIHNTIDSIVDIDNNPLPRNIVGNIALGGVGVSAGYWNKPELTEEVFYTKNGIPYYNTGDLGYKRDNGELVVVGRADSQIKLRGLRIETGEIENVILKNSTVDLVFVNVQVINDIEYLCAYYVADSQIDTNKLKEDISQELTDYMIPTFFIQLDELPLNPNGKLDRKKLPLPSIEDEITEVVEASNDIEQGIFDIVSELLGTSKFGVNTDLFKVGLTSLSVVQLVSAVYEKFNTQLMVTDVMKYKSIENIAKQITFDEEESQDLQELYPLTQNQLGVYFDCLKNPEKVTYNLPKKIEFSSPIDVDKLKNSICKAINNHPYLKTKIVMHEGEVYQQRRDAPVEDLIEIIDGEVDIKDFVKPFNLEEDLLFRFKIVNDSVLLADFHHILVDGTSLNILFDEIAKIYDGIEYEIEESDGFEYSLNEAKIENSKRYKESEQFFSNKIKEFDEATLMTPDLSGDEDIGVGLEENLYLDKDEIDELCNKLSISPNNLFLATTAFLLSKFAYNKDLLIATITNGRFNPNQQKTLAMMVKTLPLALNINSEFTINEFFEYINKEWFNVLTHSSYPLTKISDTYGIVPEFLYAFHGKIIEDIEINGETVERESLEEDNLKFKVNLNVVEHDGKYDVSIRYNNQLYSTVLIQTFLNSFSVVVNKFTSLNMETQLKDVSIVGEDMEISADNLVFDEIEEYRLNKIFERQVEINPDKTILYATDGEFTYDELNKRANNIAHSLIKKGVAPEDRVMILLARNSNFIASMFGILKAGAAFIPIDSDYPKDRIEHVLTDSESKYIITDEITEIKGIDLSDYKERLLDINELLEEENTENPDTDVKGSNLAYLIYTSGSTGLPKGVMLEHQNLANLVYPHPDNVYTYEIATNCKKEDYRVLSATTVAFDAFLHEAMCALLNGVPIVFANDDEYKDHNATLELIRKYDVNVYSSTPSRLLQYLDIDEIKDEMLNFKVYVIGGEPFPKRLYDLLREKTDAKIFNAYGPTETTISCNTVELESDDINVGKALFNVHEEIMDLDSNPLPDNVIGELYIAGCGVSREYLNRPEKNKEAYININGVRFYRSGDFAKRSPNGNVYIYGRLDNQIKLRGLRIEIGEIESAISNHEAIKDVAVVVKNINDNDYLCAYYTVHEEYKKNDEYSIDIENLKEMLGEKLVYYMIPTFFTEMDEFPRTPNDKVDLKNFPEPIIDVEDYIVPRNDTEEKLWNIISEILGTTSFGVDTDLFGIGLTSLNLLQVVSKIYETFNAQIMITQLMKSRTIEKITSLITEDGEEEFDEQKIYPLTPNQLGVYFECVKKTEDVSYNVPLKIEFGSDIDPIKLKSSIIEAINNHPYLKTRIIMQDGEVYQERRDNLVIDEYIEITDKSADEIDFVKPFVLDKGPLFRFKICKDTTLLADFHHIIMDGTSLNIFFDEVARIYDGKDYELEEVNGFEYSLNEAKIEKSNLYKEAELFFFDKIKEFEEATLISPDLNGQAEDGISLAKVSYCKKEDINDFCEKQSINPNNLFLAVTSFVLSKFVYNKNLFIATFSNGRYTKAHEKTLAMMVKTLPLALKLNTELSIKEYLGYVNEEWLNVLAYSSYPLTKISSEYDITPEFMYMYQGMINENVEISSKSVKREIIDFDFLKFNTGVQIEDTGDEYKIIFQYNDQLYSDELINTFADSFNIALNKFITYDGSTPLNSISIIEKDMITVEDIEIEKMPEYRINRIFENCVSENGGDVALYASDGIYTFNQLNAKANRIANALIKLGVDVEDRVMIVLSRNSNFIAAMFGILKAGAAFIPIDSDYPKDRIEHVLTDSESKFIITDEITEIKGIDLSDYKERLLDINELLEEENTENPDTDVKGSNLAYLIYTSGSTGLPKGVMLEHQNLANFTYPHPDNVYTYEIATNYKKEDYRVLSTATVAFDLFLHEAMCALLNGVPIVFANDDEYKDPNATLELIRKYDVNIYSSTPSRLLQYLDIDEIKDEMLDFKVYFMGGEPFPKRLYNLLREKTDAKMFNGYGPTETTICCNTVELESDDITVGKALFNVHEEIMDLDSNPLPDNVIGELYIAGPGVSREYLNRPEKNKEAYTNINGVRFYRSGDFAKRTPDGNVYIYGRLDNQIKLRGLRIEIGEIESAISKHEAIKDVAVVIRNIKNNQHLCAYFTVHDEYVDPHRKPSEFSIDIDDLKKRLSEKLTYYMVPTVYMQLDEMPQTLNGKIDIKNLPEPELVTKYVAPENDVEAFFANTFADILELDKVSVTDNFFEIGGTSLLVTKITMAAINRNYEVYYGDVFKNPTPRQLADFVYQGDSPNVSEESKYDYSGINDLLRKNTLNSLIDGEIDDSLGDVLLTGATGFLGIHVLRELINSQDGNIYCFVRSRGNLSGEDRLKSLLFYYFTEDYSDLFGNRIHIIEADITSPSDFEKMMQYNIDTIINCAANVKHFSSGTDIEDINLGGVINGLKFAKMKESKYVQVSTYSVAGLSIDNYPSDDEVFTENKLYIGQNLDNVYVNSKFLAERAILEAAVNDGLDVKIMRVGNLMARSFDSEFQINFESNGFIKRLKSYINIGKMAYDKLDQPVEFSPIDITAKSIVELSKTPKECVVFHPYNPHSIRFADVYEIIKDLGIIVDYCEEDEYQEALQEALSDKQRQEALSGMITYASGDKVKSKFIPSTNDYTIQALYRLNIVWPLIDEKYIYNFIKHLLEVDFFS